MLRRPPDAGPGQLRSTQDSFKVGEPAVGRSLPLCRSLGIEPLGADARSDGGYHGGVRLYLLPTHAMPDSASSSANSPDAPESTSSDRSLLRRFQAGQQDAATELYMRYARRLQALARKQTGQHLATRFDPEDVVQSVFRTFFRRAADGCYEAPVGEELWQLLLVLALNKIRTLAVHHRAQKRDAGRTIGVDAVGEVAGASGDDAVAYNTMKMVVDELVDSLPAPQDEIIRMRIEGHEVADIAQAVGRSKRTVERTLQQFRTRLTHLIDQNP